LLLSQVTVQAEINRIANGVLHTIVHRLQKWVLYFLTLYGSTGTHIKVISFMTLLEVAMNGLPIQKTLEN
jgi:hypothetical protein